MVVKNMIRNCYRSSNKNNVKQFCDKNNIYQEIESKDGRKTQITIPNKPPLINSLGQNKDNPQYQMRLKNFLTKVNTLT